MKLAPRLIVYDKRLGNIAWSSEQPRIEFVCPPCKFQSKQPGCMVQEISISDKKLISFGYIMNILWNFLVTKVSKNALKNTVKIVI